MNPVQDHDPDLAEKLAKAELVEKDQDPNLLLALDLRLLVPLVLDSAMKNNLILLTDLQREPRESFPGTVAEENQTDTYSTGNQNICSQEREEWEKLTDDKFFHLFFNKLVWSKIL